MPFTKLLSVSTVDGIHSSACNCIVLVDYVVVALLGCDLCNTEVEVIAGKSASVL
jgi:hypothetical protein